MRVHSNRAKHTLGLDKMIGEKKVPLGKKERDLALQEAAMEEPHAQGINPHDN
jgi:hypothetical protein